MAALFATREGVAALLERAWTPVDGKEGGWPPCWQRQKECGRPLAARKECGRPVGGERGCGSPLAAWKERGRPVGGKRGRGRPVGDERGRGRLLVTRRGVVMVACWRRGRLGVVAFWRDGPETIRSRNAAVCRLLMSRDQVYLS